jgi:hypothetical protein
MRLVLLGFGVDSQDGIVRGESLVTSMNVVVVREQAQDRPLPRHAGLEQR